MAIVSQGHFTAIGMRTKVEDDNAIVINTCGKNDTDEMGTPNSWVWCNPTNRAIQHHYQDIVAVSVEALWQGCKLKAGQAKPNPEILGGNWRLGKGRRPAGAYAGPGNPLITTPGGARRAIYIPAFRNLVEHWLQNEEVASWVQECRDYKDGPIYLRDHDTGRGIDRNGPMSHSWLLCEFLNNDQWPS